MPNRMLRDYTDSESVNRLSWQAECLFVRLIMKVDDYGRYYGDAQLLKSYLFPRKDVRTADISRWVAECETSGLIVCYVGADGKPYAAIRNFNQRMRAKKSRFPAPPDIKPSIKSEQPYAPEEPTTVNPGVTLAMNAPAGISAPRSGEKHNLTGMCQSRDGYMTVTCQTHDRHMTARDERRETRIKERDKEKTPLDAAALSVSFSLNHPKDSGEVIAEAEKHGVRISETQANDFIDANSVTAQGETWMFRNTPVRDWRKLMNSRWITNWKRDNGKGGNNASNGNYRSFAGVYDTTNDGSNF